MARPSRRRPVRFRAGVKRLTQRFEATQHPTTVNITRDLREQFKVIEDNLARVINTIKEATPEALDFALEPIFLQASEWVPIDKGPLSESLVLETSQTSAGAFGGIGFGIGESASYAVIVHEDMNVFHAPPTKAKFLEDAINKHEKDVLPRLHEFLRLT